jgi:hypothetical protein
MFLRDKDKPMVAKGLISLSLVATTMAAFGAIGYDIFLASTQWLIVAAVLGIWGVYALLEAQFRL